MEAKWIWLHDQDHADEYIDFYDTFDYDGGKAEMKISADTNYALYINGVYAFSGQYFDYPWHKVYDNLDITPFVKSGKNEIKIIVWYYGDDFMTYYKNKPGLYYVISQDNKILAVSSKDTKCRLDCNFLSHREKKITFQMSYSFRYNPVSENYQVQNAVVVDGISYNMFQRPVKKLNVEKVLKAKLVKDKIYDLGKECAGYFAIKYKAKKGAILTISYGEHLTDGCVRRKIKDGDFKTDKDYSIGYRDFSFEVVGCGNFVEFMNPFLRVGGRYYQIECDSDYEIEYIGTCETLYPVNIIKYDLKNELRQKIYDTSVRTLRLNMHEHYEDTPWREQGLYTMDSRNQMICGYYAFKEYEFPRASLELMCLDRRKDGLLSSCFPSSINLALPAFTLYFFVQMNEYIKYSGDCSLAIQYEDKLNSILDTFVNRLQDNLSPNFYGGAWYFNFYEWSEGNDGNLSGTDEMSFDLNLNCVLSIALQNMKEICDKCGLKYKYGDLHLKINQRINEEYFDKKTGLYHISQLGNSFAILCGAPDKKLSEELAEQLVDNNTLVPITLSMKVWLYDALLKVNRDRYKDWILNDIDKNYEYMLSKGATSFWETIKGEADFNGAGSLSHGWSAIPVYYYNILLKKE